MAGDDRPGDHTTRGRTMERFATGENTTAMLSTWVHMTRTRMARAQGTHCHTSVVARSPSPVPGCPDPGTDKGL